MFLYNLALKDLWKRLHIGIKCSNSCHQTGNDSPFNGYKEWARDHAPPFLTAMTLPAQGHISDGSQRKQIHCERETRRDPACSASLECDPHGQGQPLKRLLPHSLGSCLFHPSVCSPSLPSDRSMSSGSASMGRDLTHPSMVLARPSQPQGLYGQLS